MPFPFTFACWRPNLWVISKIASWENCCHAPPSRAIRIVNGRAREIIASLKGIFQPAIYKPMREVRGKDKLSSLRKCFFAPKERHAKRFIAGQRDFRFMTCWRKAGEGWTKKKVVSKEFRETSSDESNYRGMRSRARAVFTLRERCENWANFMNERGRKKNCDNQNWWAWWLLLPRFSLLTREYLFMPSTFIHREKLLH